MHSPLVGPATWEPVAECLRTRGHDVVVPSLLGFAEAGPPYLPRIRERIPAGRVLVGHSGAGPLLPAIGGERYVFVDASLPPERGTAHLAPPWLLDHFDGMTDDGRLPPWSQWWGDDGLAALVPDSAARERVAREVPSLPRAYFDEQVPIPDGWSDAPCGYVLLSGAYADDAADARARGWPVEAFGAGHLHMLVAPADVADAIERVIR